MSVLYRFHCITIPLGHHYCYYSHYGYCDDVLIFAVCSCNSFVGRESVEFQPQGINLGSGCVYLEVVVHEVGHAIGFFHEQSRPDRDEYVYVNESNIEDPSLKHNFDIVPEYYDTTTLNLGYDYASIMHYRPTAFAKPGTVTLVAIKPNITFGRA